MVLKLVWAGKCRAAYERAVKLEPGNPAFHWSLLGFFYAAPRLAGGGIEKAHAQAEAIGKLDAMNGRIARATLALGEEKFDLAFAQFDAVLHDAPDERKGDAVGAQREYATARLVHPDFRASKIVLRN